MGWGTSRRAWLLTGVGLAVLWSVPQWAPTYTVGLLQALFTYAALATAWSLFSGLSGYLSLGSAAFFGVGTYTTFLLATRVGWIPSIGVAAAAGAAMAAAVGGVSLRLKGPYFAILTFGLSELVRYLTLGYEMRFSGTVGRVLILPVGVGAVYTAALVVAAVIVALNAWLYTSRYGRLLAAIGADEERVEALGFQTTWLKVALFVVSGALTAAVGAAVAPRWTYVDAHMVFHPLISFQAVLMAMVGGVTRWWGPPVGAMVLGIATEFLSVQFRYLYLILLGSLLIVLVRFWPQGLAEVEQRVPRWRRGGVGAPRGRRVDLQPGWEGESDS